MKQYVKLNRDYNGIPKNTIGLIISIPNYFVKDIQFNDKIIRIDNNYINRIDNLTSKN